MEDVLVPLIIFGSVVAIVKIVHDAKTRNRLIDKGLVDERVRQMFVGQSELSVLSNLKWGMILIGVGVAVLAWEYLDWRLRSEGLLGLILVLAGLGFLIYYPIAQRRLHQIEERQKMQGPPSPPRT